MSRSGWKPWGAAVAGALALSGGIAAWYRLTWGHRPEPDSAQEQDTTTDSTPETEPEPRPKNDPPPDLPKEEEPPPPASQPAPAPPPARRASLSHSADPCRPVASPDLPGDYPRVTAQGVTVAWLSGEAPISEPTAFAYLVAGLLEEAALLTGTARREQVTVILYDSMAQFHAITKAPSWADGLYTGTVHLPVFPSRDFGVRLQALRHELMHAQLHSVVGCMPVWFNEGLAMRFGGQAPRRGWIRMLRDRLSLDFDALAVSSVDELPKPDPEIVYAQSLAMVLFLEERSPEDAIEDAVGDLVAGRSRPRAEVLRLWSRLRPGASRADLLNALSRRVFQMPTGPDLDSLFQKSAICCYGTTRLAQFGCRGAPPQPGKTSWLDDSRKPIALCETD
jgi:hypothetical protein